jgi:hypothetical protein
MKESQGHRGPVCACLYNHEFDVAVSGDEDSEAG